MLATHAGDRPLERSRADVSSWSAVRKPVEADVAKLRRRTPEPLAPDRVRGVAHGGMTPQAKALR